LGLSSRFSNALLHAPGSVENGELGGPLRSGAQSPRMLRAPAAGRAGGGAAAPRDAEEVQHGAHAGRTAAGQPWSSIAADVALRRTLFLPSRCCAEICTLSLSSSLSSSHVGYGCADLRRAQAVASPASLRSQQQWRQQIEQRTEALLRAAARAHAR
jgi:hypothetical protein